MMKIVVTVLFYLAIDSIIYSRSVVFEQKISFEVIFKGFFIELNWVREIFSGNFPTSIPIRIIISRISL